MEGPRYDILTVIGRGGFGLVYRARRLGAHGFQREVALKILTDIHPPPEVLARFRDEARLLGRIRHPHLPGVGPPVRLGEHWAVEMDLVEGVDCHRLVKKRGPMPVRVALEVVAGIASTLHELYHWQNEPDDTPLHLIHRDIKPSNIMITHRGSLALLDFGIAKAEFDTRESFTTDHIGGTVGYMPPERVEGVDGPEGDIYSLGVVFHMLLTGQKPQAFSELDEVEISEIHKENLDEYRDAIALAATMRSLNPSDRPSSAQVAEMCASRAAVCPGPDLKAWATVFVPERIALKEDDRVGTTLSEESRRTPVPRPQNVPLFVVAGLITAVVLLGLGVAGGWLIRPPERVIRPPSTPAMPAALATGGVAPTRVERYPNGELVIPALIAVPEPVPEPEPIAAAPVPEPVEVLPTPVATAPVPPRPAVPRPDPVTRPGPVTRPDPVTRPGPVTRPAPLERPVPTVPDPKPEPKPVVSRSTTGRVQLANGEPAWLQQGSTKFELEAPPGTYDLYVRFDGKPTHAATVELLAGRTRTARCNSRFRKCTVE
ncbi:MAG: protein kinase [Myxococcota bacterium]